MARNIGVKRLGNALKPIAGSRVQISPPANPIFGVKPEPYLEQDYVASSLMVVSISNLG